MLCLPFFASLSLSYVFFLLPFFLLKSHIQFHLILYISNKYDTYVKTD